MDDTYASDSSGGRHPAEDLIIQKALRRAAGTAASTSNIHDLPAHAQVVPDGPPELVPQFEGGPPGLAPPPAIIDPLTAEQVRQLSEASRAAKSKKKRRRKADRDRADLAKALAPRMSRLAPGILDGVPVIKGHPQPADKHDIDAMSLHSSDSEEAGIALGNAPELPNGAQRPRVAAPLGVTVVADDEETAHAPEMQRLLRQRRYFDADYEAASVRCFRCGGQGHMSRDCPNEERQRPCYLCAQFGHARAQCTNMLCFKCNQPGHMARDCPNGYAAAAAPAVCLRCGRGDCPAAGGGDYLRAEGGCAFDYSRADLAEARCAACGRRGHLSCAGDSQRGLPPWAPSCANCGRGGHTDADCPRGRPAAVQNERRSQQGWRPPPYDGGYATPPMGDRWDMHNGNNGHYSEPSQRHQDWPGRGGDTYAQRVSRMQARTDSPQDWGHRKRKHTPPAHIRWEEEEYSY